MPTERNGLVFLSGIRIERRNAVRVEVIAAAFAVIGIGPGVTSPFAMSLKYAVTSRTSAAVPLTDLASGEPARKNANTETRKMLRPIPP